MFAPRYVKEAKIILKSARKLLHYKRDVLSAVSVADFEREIATLEHAIRERNQRAVEDSTKRLDEQWSTYLPPARDAAWRENCEVFLVAIIIAIAVRTYFLQPFTIPTGSMQPTLNGIIGYSLPEEKPPGFFKQVWDFLTIGRNYIDVVSKSDDRVESLKEWKFLYFFTFTKIECTNNSYTVYAPMDTLTRQFQVYGPSPYHAASEYHAGDVIARGHIDAGDHVFVDKLSYNFRLPHRGEVFVFKTTKIGGIESDLQRRGIEGSQFYIKRLGGLPGDELRIDAPNLFVNGEMAKEFGFRRVMSAQGDYRGYTYGPMIMNAPDKPFPVPPKEYFALGDNSYNSFDSRYWGTVPQANIMGRGVFVYWPFSAHWGFVK